jgi:prepilin-type processing-associated H-X9-DG protein
MTTPLQNRRQALTLVEIVVVTVAIAMLAILAVPFGIRYQESRRREACMNNARQIGLACKQWACDGSDRFPSGSVVSARAVDCFELMAKEKYIAAGAMFVCPSDRTARIGSFFTVCTNSYCYVTQTADGTGALSESESSSQPLVLDKSLDGTPNPSVESRTNSLFCTSGTSPHRGEGGNVYFVGGHVKWLAQLAPEISDGTNGFILRAQ